MPISRKEVEEIRNRELKVYNEVRDFLEKEKGLYFSAQEVAEKMNLPIKEVARQLEALCRNSPMYCYNTGVEKRIAIDKIEKEKEVFYYGYVS